MQVKKETCMCVFELPVFPVHHVYLNRMWNYKSSYLILDDTADHKICSAGSILFPQTMHPSN